MAHNASNKPNQSGSSHRYQIADRASQALVSWRISQLQKGAVFQHTADSNSAAKLASASLRGPSLTMRNPGPNSMPAPALAAGRNSGETAREISASRLEVRSSAEETRTGRAGACDLESIITNGGAASIR